MAPVHTGKMTKAGFKQYVIPVNDWPENSSDLNTVVNRKTRDTWPNAEELKAAVKTTSVSITPQEHTTHHNTIL